MQDTGLGTRCKPLECKDIEFIGKEQYPGKYFIPLGWYETEYAVAVKNEDGEEMITLSNAVMVYEANIDAFKRLIDYFTANHMPDEWSSESVSTEEILDGVYNSISKIIDFEEDDVDGNLRSGIVHIIRHIAQNGTAPEFVPFEIREQYDIDCLVDEYADLNQQQLIVKLKADFHDSRLLWSRLYKKFEWFWQAYTDAVIRSTYNKTTDNIEEVIIQDLQEKQPEHYRTALLIRDNHRCRCCGRLLGKGVKLEIDHIIPVKVGGKTTLDNLQVLCKTCNIEKGTHLISFLNNRTPLEKPMDFKFTKSNSYEPVDCTIKRIINFFYRANAVILQTMAKGISRGEVDIK